MGAGTPSVILVNRPKSGDPRCIEPVRIDRDFFERQWWGMADFRLRGLPSGLGHRTATRIRPGVIGWLDLSWFDRLPLVVQNNKVIAPDYAQCRRPSSRHHIRWCGRSLGLVRRHD